MDIKIGSFVTRKSYNHDIIFKVLNIKDNICYLKGQNIRLYADSPIEDLIISEITKNTDNFEVALENDRSLDRNEYFYMPAKILHLDGDEDYLNRCLNYYRSHNLKAYGKVVSEQELPQKIMKYLSDYNPDIVIITGHDAYYKKKGSKSDLNNYRNSKYFCESVKKARKYEKDHDKLVIIAGACQSDYEELIKSGANYASSPKRVNIHALDPAIIASTIALTSKMETINLIELLNKTKYGSDGMGGVVGNGLMYVGYPR